jgi:hypothetical protein
MQKRPSIEELGGMTVNERIFVCGLMDQWDGAASQRDRNEMMRILSEVALSEDQARFTVETILANPKKYGY